LASCAQRKVVGWLLAVVTTALRDHFSFAEPQTIDGSVCAENADPIWTGRNGDRRPAVRPLTQVGRTGPAAIHLFGALEDIVAICPKCTLYVFPHVQRDGVLIPFAQITVFGCRGLCFRPSALLFFENGDLGLCSFCRRFCSHCASFRQVRPFGFAFGTGNRVTLCVRRSFKLAGSTRLRAIEYCFSRLGVRQALLYKRHDSRPSLHRVVQKIGGDLAFLDLADVKAVNGLYAELFPEGQRPARTIYQAARLPFGGRIKVQAVAAR